MVKNVLGIEMNVDMCGRPLKENKRKGLYAYDKDQILLKQKGLCAGKDCKRIHGKRIPVNIRNNLDHIIPLEMGGKDVPSNMQYLCANCHMAKTREDRKNIAVKKKKKPKQNFGILGINPNFKPPKSIWSL